MPFLKGWQKTEKRQDETAADKQYWNITRLRWCDLHKQTYSDRLIPKHAFKDAQQDSTQSLGNREVRNAAY